MHCPAPLYEDLSPSVPQEDAQRTELQAGMGTPARTRCGGVQLLSPSYCSTKETMVFLTPPLSRITREPQTKASWGHPCTLSIPPLQEPRLLFPWMPTQATALDRPCPLLRCSTLSWGPPLAPTSGCVVTIFVPTSGLGASVVGFFLMSGVLQRALNVGPLNPSGESKAFRKKCR